jgi:hypothetical protein
MHKINTYIKTLTIITFSSTFFCHSIFGLTEKGIGKVDLRATVTSDFDSNIFSNEKELDDVVIRFTPTASYNKRFGPLIISVTGGGNFARYINNPEEDFSNPITQFNIGMAEDFGIFSVDKRTAGKIKFGFDTDISQRTETNEQLQDLVSYTLYTANFEVRYNHSPKFGISIEAGYDFRDYNDLSSISKYYTDILTTNFGSTVYYIYSPKLDLYLNYNFSKFHGKSKAGRNFFTNNDVSRISVGAEGTFTPKLSGNASVGYAFRTFENTITNDEEGLIFNMGLNWQFRQKTGASFNLMKSFLPTAQDNAMVFSTYSANITQKFSPQLLGSAGYFYSTSDFLSYRFRPYDSLASGSTIYDRTDIMQGLNLSVSNAISRFLTATARYTYTTTDSGYGSDFSNERHLLSLSATVSY